MTSSPNLFSGVSIWVVSLICLPLAAMLLIVPLHRLIEPLWPVTVEEHILLDGTIRLVRVDGCSIVQVDGRIRSSPLSAAVLDLADQPSRLGYVVAVQLNPAESEYAMPDRSAPIPVAGWWRPSDLWGVEQPRCSLALSQPGRDLQWLPCSGVRRVVLPNQLSLFQKLDVALDRLEDMALIEEVPIGPAESNQEEIVHADAAANSH